MIVSFGLLLAAGMLSATAQANASADYFPLEAGNSWDYAICKDSVSDGVCDPSTWSVTKTVLSEAEITAKGIDNVFNINGEDIPTKVIEDSSGQLEFYTNDETNGLLRYGYKLINYEVDHSQLSCTADLTVTFDPPIKYINAAMEFGGEPVQSSGQATFLFGNTCPFLEADVTPLDYVATSTVGEGFEHKTVPLGRFKTIKVEVFIDFSGTWHIGPAPQTEHIVDPVPDPTQTTWLAKGVGSVYYYDDLGDDQWVYELTGTSLPIRRAMPWIPLLLLD